MPTDYKWLLKSVGPEGSAQEFFSLGKKLELKGDLHTAATAYDRAFGLDSKNEEIRSSRAKLLDSLSLEEHGIRFRYIPAGSFLMGSAAGEPDESPVHPVELGHYWLSETPISWASFCSVLKWKPPPDGLPEDFDFKNWEKMEDPVRWARGGNLIRLQYCETGTLRAQKDWHAHSPEVLRQRFGATVTSKELFGEITRQNPAEPWTYDQKPMIAVRRDSIALMCKAMNAPQVQFCLPTEAQWEKAARGGLINQPFPWGAEPPTPENCDFARFNEFSIRPMRHFPPNGYGLYAMSGGVWEWSSDWYDAQSYSSTPTKESTEPTNESREYVVRGGSWSDCKEVQTVSFRMSLPHASHSHGSTNVGFRLCRMASKHESDSWWSRIYKMILRA